jgi:hypothetical protein
MTVTAEQLIAPQGELEPALFPVGDLQTRVDAYLVDAQAKAVAANVPSGNQDAAVTAWVYHRAYTAVARRLAVEPERAEVDDQGRTYNVKQAGVFQSLADQFKAEFEGYIPVAVAQPTARRPRGSASVSTEAVW